MESDAERVAFGDDLFKVIEGMTKLETEQLKFLCFGHIPVGTIEQMDITDLLQSLKERRIISADKYDFLIECLILIGRNDIAHQLGCDTDDMHALDSSLQKYKSFAGLESFIILLHTVADNMEEKEVKKIVVYFSETAYISRGKLKMCHNGFQLMSLLLKVRHIQANNLKTLLDLVQVLNRKDLEEKIKLYQDINSSSDESYKPTSYVPEENKNKSDDDDDDDDNSDKNADNGGWKELINSVPSIKHYALFEKLGISETQYKISNKTKKLDTLLKHNFEQNNFELSDLEKVFKELKIRFPPGFKEHPDISSKLETERNLQHYKMTAKPRGICLIFNNVHFMTEKLKDRIGSDVDKDELVKVFTNFHFEIIEYRDLTKTEMRAKLGEVSSMDHREYDCFVCCILSHGTEGIVYGVDGEPLPYTNITSPFQPSKCKSLTGKPKLYFIQACQGLAYQSGEEDIEFDGLSMSVPTSIPNEADFLMAYATVSGYVSFRSKRNGSWFIQNLCKVFRDCSKKYDLSDMLLMVNNSVSKEDGLMGNQIYKQIPAPLSTLRKKVFF